MGRYKSAEEVEQEHLQAMGPTLGPLYHVLYNDVVWLHAKWQQYQKLFAEAPARVRLLNDVAGFLFGVVQRVLWDDALLHLARLVDPAKSFGRDDKANATLLALPAAISDAALASKVTSSINEAKERCAFAVDWRMRHLAHRDLALALKSPGASPLPPVHRADVEEALKSIRTTLNLVHSHYLHMEHGIEYFIPPLTDADALLHRLRGWSGGRP